MRTRRVLTFAGAMAIVAALIPAASAATEVPYREAKVRARTSKPGCDTAFVTPPNGAINTQSWSGSDVCSGSFSTQNGPGTFASSADLDYDETWEGDVLRAIEANGAADASASIPPDSPQFFSGSVESDASSGYGIRIVVPEETPIGVSGSLTETTNGTRDPCAFVSLTTGAPPGQPGAQTLFSQQGPGTPATPDATGLDGGGCTADANGSSTFSFEGTVPAGPITLLVVARTDASASGSPTSGLPTSETTTAAFVVSLALDCTDFGTVGDDTLTGTSGDDVLCGLSGNDTLTGNEGNDKLIGGPGADRLTGGAGDDTLRGGDGDDPYLDGDDLLGGDTVTGHDTIFGGPGNDEASGGPLGDDIDGEAGDDSLHGEGGVDTLKGGSGVDRLTGGADGDILDGGDGDDPFLDGDDLQDPTIAGDDVIAGGDGHDQASGGPGDDTMDGGAGDDLFFGDAGDDKLFGRAGSDKLIGEGGKDCLNGGARKDVLKGGDARDTILARDGVHDVVKGGAGNDRGRVDGVDQVVSLENQNHQGGC